MPKSILSLSLLLCVGSLSAAVFQSTVVTGIPDGTGIVVAPTGDNRVFVLQRTGQLRIVENGVLLPTPAVNLASLVDFPTSNFTAGAQEHGLIGAALDPSFATNGYVYVHYNTSIPGGAANRVSRFTMTGNTIAPASQLTLIDLPGNNQNGHVGGGLQFGADGKLYVAVGDRYKYSPSSTAPPTTAVFGSVLRLNSDGTFPVDNPFPGSPVFVNGLRNPYALAVNPSNGQMFINDAGENTWEEINAVAFGSGQLGASAGANFGWRSCEGFYDFVPSGISNVNLCSAPGTTLPVFAYGSNGTGDCAITAGAFYQSSYLFADYCSGKIRQLDLLSLTATTLYTINSQGPVALATSSDGLGVFYLDRRNGGTLGYLSTVPEPATLLTMALALGFLLLRQSRFQLRPASVKSLYRSLRRV